MAGPDDDIDFLVASLDRSIDGLRRGLEVLEATKDLRGTQFLTYLSIAIEGISARGSALVKQSGKTTDPIDRASVGSQLRRLHQAVKVLHRQTGPVIGLRTPSIGLGVVYFVEEAANAIVRTESQLIVRPDTEHTYSTLGQQQVFAGLFSSVHVGLPPGPLPVLIQYPWIERESVALHVLFLHELGHEAAQRDGLTTKIWDQHPDRSEMDNRFAEVIERVVATHNASGRSTTPEEVEAALRAQFASWVEELACDAIATAYVGPSFLFAFIAFLGAGDRQASSSTHPAFADRVRYILALLDDLGWSPLLDEKVPEIATWVRKLGEETARPSTDDRGTFVATVISELAPVIRQVSVAHLGESVFTPATYQRPGDELELLVREGIPPIQLGTKEAVGRREMFLAAWLGTLGHLGNEPSAIPKAVADPTLQALHAQAIELSFLLEEWTKP